MALETYFMFSVVHSSDAKASLASAKIDYVEREEFKLKDEENKNKIDYIEREELSIPNKDTSGLQREIELDEYNKYREDFAGSQSYNIPKFAEDIAEKTGQRASKVFFDLSEKHEPAGWNNYHEIKIPIPNECTYEDGLAIGNKIMKENELGEVPFVIAMHDKEATLATAAQKLHMHIIYSDPTKPLQEIRNKHLHIVYSDRKPDETDRSLEQYFKQYRPKNPDKGGCEKDDRFTQKGQKNRIQANKDMRKVCADVINDYYTSHNIEKHVDPRPKDEIFKEAYENKDYDLCEILAVQTQKHLELYKSKNLDHPETRELLAVKAQILAIKDRQLIERLNDINSDKETSELMLPSKEIEREIADIKLQINRITDRIQSKLSDAEKIVKEDITGVKIKNIDITIDNKKRVLSLDITKSARRAYMNKEKMIPEFIEHERNIDSLKWHKEKFETKTKLFEDRKNNNKNTSVKETNYYNSLQRTIQRLEENIARFEEEHFINNPKFNKAEAEAEVIANNQKIEHYITVLEGRKKELLNPILKEIALERENLADEYINFQEIKNEFLNEPKPKFYETDKLKARDIKLKEFDKLDKEFKQRENVINEKSDQSIFVVKSEETVEEKINTLENTFKQTKAEIDTKIESFASEAITTAQALEATLNHLKELNTSLRATDFKLKNINSQYIYKCDAEKMAKEKFIGFPLKEAENEQSNIEIEEKSIQNANNQYDKNLSTFSQMAKPKWHDFSYSTTYKETEANLKTELQTITNREAALLNRKTNNEKQFANIELQCNTLEARTAIDKMVQDILAPNKPLSVERLKLSTEKKKLEGIVSTFTKMKITFEKQLKFETTQSKKNKTLEKVYVAKITTRANSGATSGNVGSRSNPSLLKSLANAMGALIPKDAPVAGMGSIDFKLGEDLDFDWSAMTPDQIEAAVAKISKANEY